MSNDTPWISTADGMLLTVRLTARGGRDAVDGIAADADGRSVLRIRIGAPPVDGAANRALIAFVAATLGLPTRDVSIRSGEASRLKRLHIAGDASAVEVALASLTSPAPPTVRSRRPRHSS